MPKHESHFFWACSPLNSVLSTVTTSVLWTAMSDQYVRNENRGRYPRLSHDGDQSSSRFSPSSTSSSRQDHAEGDDGFYQIGGIDGHIPEYVSLHVLISTSDHRMSTKGTQRTQINANQALSLLYSPNRVPYDTPAEPSNSSSVSSPSEPAKPKLTTTFRNQKGRDATPSHSG